MINNVAKLLKNVNSLHQAEIALRHTSHEKNKQIHCFGLLFCQEIRFGKIVVKSEKTHFFKRSRRAPHQKKTKNHVLCPEIKQRYSHANRAQSNFFVKKLQKTCFWKKYVSAPNEKSRNVAKLGCFDDWQSQKKSVISWFLDSGKLILLGKRKVVCCCSFLLWCF